MDIVQSASVSAASALPAFSMGSVLRGTLGILRQNFQVFLGLGLFSAVLAALCLIGAAWFGADPGDSPTSTLQGFTIGCMLTVVEGAMAYAVYQVRRGEPVTIFTSMSRGMARFGSLLAVVLVIFLFMLICLMCLIIPGHLLMSRWAVVVPPYFNDMIVPAIVLLLTIRWAVAAPVCAVERLHVRASLKRSSVLTRGRRLKVAGLTILIYVFSHVLELAMKKLTASLGGMTLTLLFVESLIVFIPQLFSNIIVATMYYELRMSREGVQIDSLAHVFE